MCRFTDVIKNKECLSVYLVFRRTCNEGYKKHLKTRKGIPKLLVSLLVSSGIDPAVLD